MTVTEVVLLLGCVYFSMAVKGKGAELKEEETSSEEVDSAGGSSIIHRTIYPSSVCDENITLLISDNAFLKEQFKESLNNVSLLIHMQNVSNIRIESFNNDQAARYDKKAYVTKLLQQYLRIVKKSVKDGDYNDCLHYVGHSTQGREEEEKNDNDNNNTFTILQRLINEETVLQKEQENVSSINPFEISHQQEEGVCEALLTDLEIALGMISKNQTTVEESIEQFKKTQNVIQREYLIQHDRNTFLYSKYNHLDDINSILVGELLKFTKHNECYKGFTEEIIKLLLPKIWYFMQRE